MDSVNYADPSTLGGLNLYAYCNNNPVMYVDPTGHSATVVLVGLIVGAIVGAIVGGTVAGVVAYNYGERGWDLFGWTMLGIFGGAVIGGAIGALAGWAGGPGAGAAAKVLAVGKGTVSVQTLVKVGVAGLGVSVLLAKWVPPNWPGDDPTVSPGDGFEWRGKGSVGSNKGNWFNPSTGEMLHPDLNHPKGIDPHWDYYSNILENWYRIFRNGGMFLK